jgi:hypothetical protein
MECGLKAKGLSGIVLSFIEKLCRKGLGFEWEFCPGRLNQSKTPLALDCGYFVY